MAVKTLDTLIRLHKQRVDIMRREMVAFEEERRQLLAFAERLKREHAEEMQLMLAEVKVASFFGSYSAGVKQKLLNIDGEVKRLDAAIEEKAEAIREEFSEQKKYEITRETTLKRIEQKEKNLLQQRFDEIGSQQYHKAKENPL